MNSDLYGLIELILVFGLVIGFAVWQLISLERDKKKPKDKTTAPPDSK